MHAEKRALFWDTYKENERPRLRMWLKCVKYLPFKSISFGRPRSGIVSASWKGCRILKLYKFWEVFFKEIETLLEIWKVTYK